MARALLIYLACLCLLLAGSCDKGAKAPDQATAGAAATDQPVCTSVDTCRPRCERCGDSCNDDDATACLQLGRLHTRLPADFDLARAAQAYDRACTGGALEACAALGLQVQDGRGRDRDRDRAVALYQRACDGGRGVGCFNLGLMHASGTGDSLDQERADELFRQAATHYRKSCDAGELPWCMNLGVLYENGYGVDKDEKRSLAIYSEACHKGHGDSCVNLGLQELYGRGTVANPAGALKRIADVCAGKDEFLACSVLGQMYLQSFEGVERAPKRALTPLTRGCDGGQRQACFALARLYGLGEGTKRDPVREKAALERACTLGSARACRTLAEFERAETPDGSPQVADYYRRACYIGDGGACAQLALALENGIGVARNPEAAAALVVDSCRLGFTGSCTLLIERGHALPLPADKARYIYEDACRNGVPNACDGVTEDM